MEIEVAKNFEFIYDNFQHERAFTQHNEWKNKGYFKQIFVHEGGSGSAKTWDIAQYIIYYCQVCEGMNKRILIYRQRYSDCKDTVLEDFITILKKYGIYNQNDHTRSNPQSYNLFGNTVRFRGLDNMGSHGKRNDIIWGNEIMEHDFDSFRQLNQRTNEAVFLDYNPSQTYHWVYNSVIPREDAYYIKTTLLDNPFLPDGQRNEILSYKPTPENIRRGTADDYMWGVYGLGNRSNPKGLIFKNVEWVEAFPSIHYVYGLDFGYTNDPTALVKCGIKGNDSFYELKCYEPIDNAFAISEMLKNAGVTKSDYINADSADRYNDQEMVLELRQMGWNIHKVNKGKGVMWRIGKMKSKKINIVHNLNAKREAENYKFREIAGQTINEPIDKFNHFWDAAGYGFLALNISTPSAKTYEFGS